MTPSRLLVTLAIATLELGCAGAEKVSGPIGAALEIETDLGVGFVLQPAIPQPVVRVVDADGAPVAKAGIAVTATVPWGDVKVIRGGTAVTDATGRARFSELTFGALSANSGEFDVQYTSPGLTPVGESEAITCRVGPVQAGVAETGDLRDGDCLEAGSRYRYYDESTVFPNGRTALRVTQSASFAPAVFARKRFDFDGGYFGAIGFGAGSVSIKMLVPAVDIRFIASSAGPNVFGSFQLTYNAVPDHEPGCEGVYFLAPISSTQTLESSCTDDQGNVGDYFPFLLTSGSTITVTATSSAFTPYVSIWSYSTNLRVAHEVGAANTASVTYLSTGGAGEVFYVFVGSASGTGVGSYTLQVGASPSIQPRAASLRAKPVRTSATFVPGKHPGGPRLSLR